MASSKVKGVFCLEGDWERDLYLGFHGSPGHLHVGHGPGSGIDLKELEERLEGKCQKRIIRFGSCGTLEGRALSSLFPAGLCPRFPPPNTQLWS